MVTEIDMPPKWWNESVYQAYLEHFTRVEPYDPEDEKTDLDRYWDTLTLDQKAEQYPIVIRALVGTKEDPWKNQNEFSDQMKEWRENNPASVAQNRWEPRVSKELPEEELKAAPVRATFKLPKNRG